MYRISSNEHRFKTVTTDYFDIDAVVESLTELVSEDQFSDITFDDDLKTIMDKYAIKERSINRYQKTLPLKTTTIIRGATLRCFLNIDAYKLVKSPYTGYGRRTYYRNTYVLDKTARAKSIVYSLSLSGKGIGKEDMVIDGVMKQLKQYTFTSKQNTYQNYKSNNHKLRISKNYNKISFMFSPV